jgi:hypothetical protein
MLYHALSGGRIHFTGSLRLILTDIHNRSVNFQGVQIMIVNGTGSSRSKRDDTGTDDRNRHHEFYGISNTDSFHILSF